MVSCRLLPWESMEMMAGKVQKGRYLFCPAGSHMAMYDDQKVYFKGLIPKGTYRGIDVDVNTAATGAICVC